MFSRLAKPTAAGAAGLRSYARFFNTSASLANRAQGSKGRQMPTGYTRTAERAAGKEATFTIRVCRRSSAPHLALEFFC